MNDPEMDKLLRKIHGRWPTLALMRKEKINRDVWDEWVLELADLPYSDAYKVFQEYSRRERAMPEGRETPDLGSFLAAVRDCHRAQPSGPVLWQHGDVVEYDGVKGVIHRDDGCGYVGWNIFVLGNGERVYVQGGHNKMHEATKVPDEQAEHWTRTWWDRVKGDRLYYPGLEAAAKRFGLIEGKKPVPKGRTIEQIRAGNKERGGAPEKAGDLF